MPGTSSRAIGQKLGEAFGQQVVVDNRPGANGIIGTDLVAKAPPDGHVIVMGNSGPFVFNPSLYQKLPYDPVKDFAPVTQATRYPYVLIVHPALPAKNVQELAALAKAKPGQLQYGSTGAGGANHIAGEMFKRMAGVDLVHVPFKGSAQALAEVLAGQIPIMFDTAITTLPQMRAGKVRVLAVTGTRRIVQMPDVATMDELGFKGYDVTSWQAILTTAGTPRAVVDRLYQETVTGLKMQDVIDRLATQGGNELVGSSPDEFAATIRSEMSYHAKFIREAGIRLE